MMMAMKIDDYMKSAGVAARRIRRKIAEDAIRDVHGNTLSNEEFERLVEVLTRTNPIYVNGGDDDEG